MIETQIDQSDLHASCHKTASSKTVPFQEDLYDNNRLKNTLSNDPRNRTVRKIGDHERDIDASIQALDQIEVVSATFT